MIYASRDGKQCWSYIGSRQGIGCGSKINSSLATSPSVTWDISRTCYRWHVDAGKIYKLRCWTLISSLDKFHSSQNYTWCVCFLAGAQHSKTANSYTWSPAAWPWPELTCLYMIFASYSILSQDCHSYLAGFIISQSELRKAGRMSATLHKIRCLCCILYVTNRRRQQRCLVYTQN